jgi:DNA-binding SARP family transcriptional activator
VGAELRALGPVEAMVGGRLVDLGPPMQHALFGLLLSRVGRPVAVDVVAGGVAGGGSTSGDDSLRAYVSNLRRVLEPIGRLGRQLRC